MPCDAVATVKTILTKVRLGEFSKSAQSFAPLKNYLEKEGFINVSLTVYGLVQVISLNSSTITAMSGGETIIIDSPIDNNDLAKIQKSIAKLQGFLAQQKAVKAIKKKFEVSSQTTSNKSVVLTIKL